MQLIHGLDLPLISSPCSLSFSPFLSLVSLSPSLPLSSNLKTFMDPYSTPSQIVNISASFFRCKAITLNSQCQFLRFLMGITYAFVFIFLRLYFCLDLALLEQKALLICRVFHSLLLICGDLVLQCI